MLGLQLATSVAAGLEFMGLKTMQVPVTVYSAEDDARILMMRLQRILKHYQISSADIAKQLHLIDATTIDPTLFREAQVKDDNGSTSRRGLTTAAYTALVDACHSTGSRLLIIDNGSDVFEANENERQRVRQFIRSLANIARAIDGAVLLLTHVDKSTAKAGGSSEGYSGSTAWHNSVRSRLFLSGDGDFLTLEHQKANHGPKADDIPLSWVNGLIAHGHVRNLGAEAAQGLLEARQHKDILRLIHEATERGQNISTSTTAGNAYATLSAMGDFPKGLQKKSFWQLVARAEKNGELVREAFKDAARRTKERFRVTESGLDYCALIEAGEQRP